MHMTQMFIGFNTRLNPNMSFSGSYVLGSQKSDSDGGFPINSYDMSGEWGRASSDIRHRFNLFGSYTNPKLWKLSFNPFLVINSGGPFNIITGTDSNQDRVATERPTFAQLNAYCATRADRCTKFDYTRTDNAIIPRNYGHAPGSVSVNLRVGRTFSWGGEARSAANRQQQSNQSGGQGKSGGGDVANAKRGAGNATMISGGMAGGGGDHGGGARGGGGGGPQVMMMGGPGGPGGPAKYNLTISVNFNNILNHVNYSSPQGSLTSPSFGQSLSTSGGFGGFGGGGGGSDGLNRKIYLNARFTF
jgi:hypothetical protein